MEDKYEENVLDEKNIPLLLIHGIFSSAFVWHKNIDELSRYFDVIAVDLKGYGYSDKPADGRYNREDIREFMIDFMDAIKIDSILFVVIRVIRG